MTMTPLMMDCQTEFYDNVFDDEFLGCLTDSHELTDGYHLLSELHSNRDVNFDDNAVKTEIFPSVNPDDFLTDTNLNDDCITVSPQTLEYPNNVAIKTVYNYCPDNQFVSWKENLVTSKFSAPLLSRQEVSNFIPAKIQQKPGGSSGTLLLNLECVGGDRLSTRPKYVLPKSLDVSSNGTANEVTKKSASLFRGKEVNEKTLKRQIRMIKNRESANMSRKKKRDYVMALENRVSELLTENFSLKNENESLKAQIKGFNSAYPCVCNEQGIKISSLNRKNTAVLLAMIFMISLNFGSINIFLSRSGRHANEMKTDKLQTGRHLLWVQNSSEEKINMYPNIEMSKDETFPMCPVPINQTENIRLASELRKWIADNRFGNQSSQNVGNTYAAMKKGKKGKRLQMRNSSKRILKGKLDETLERFRKGKKIKNEQMQTFNLQKEEQFGELLKKINRQADTFYVLAFNTDHLLLPADIHNKIMRPKMSFVLPAGNDLFEGLISLLQIDCVVMNTSAIQLEENGASYNLRNMSRKVSPPATNKVDVENPLNHESKVEVRDISLNDFIIDKDNHDFISMLPSFAKKNLKGGYDVF